MAKIMLVEDDTSLLEIYQARLEAEGFTVVTAHDGEEALTVALKEHPDLIIADVMMPKVSGFDMVDILRSTPETKGTKIIMMTALNQAEDKARAEKLGADRYLVKSQVTLEDVTRIVHEIISEQETAETDTVASATGSAPEQNTPQPVSPAAKPQAKIAPVAVATEPQSNNSQSADSAPSNPPNDEKNSQTQQAPQASETPQEQKTQTPPSIQPISVVEEPPKTEPPKEEKSISMPPSPEMSPPTNSAKDAAAKPKPITVTSDDSASTSQNDKPDNTQSNNDNQTKDPFLAQNPTLSDSPTSTPASTVQLGSNSGQSKPSDQTSSSEKEETKTGDAKSKDNQAAQKIAEDAVDSLLKNNTSEQKQPEDSSGRGYVSTEKEENDDNKSLKHTKVIQPTPGIAEQNEKPNLPDLSSAPGDEGSNPPAVSSVIAPDPESGPPSSSL